MIDPNDIIQDYLSGKLVERISSFYLPKEDENDHLYSELISLHNARKIDVIQAFSELRNNSSNFFSTRRVLEQILPKLEFPVQSVMRCVKRLFDEAGRDLAAGTIIESFVQFCKVSPTRPQEALVEVEADPGQYMKLLRGVLISGFHCSKDRFFDQTIRLCKDKNIEFRRCALLTLGDFPFEKDDSRLSEAISLLEHSIAHETDDLILGNAIRAVFEFQRRRLLQHGHSASLIDSALARGGDFSLFSASEILGFHGQELSKELIVTLIRHLNRFQPEKKGILENIDHGMARILNSDESERAIHFLESLLQKHSEQLTLRNFGNTSRAILANKPIFGRVLTRWLISGNRALCNNLGIIICDSHIENLPLEIDLFELPLRNPEQFVFVARKAIGYLFFKPISAASILISLMRNTTDAGVLRDLGKLLFNPLLLNYSRTLKEYVEKQSKEEDKIVNSTILQAIKALDNYLENLSSVGCLLALHPCEAQREAYRRHFSRIFEESMRDAEKKSVLLSLFPKRVLLYGNKSICYINHSDGQLQRTEIPLQRHEAEMECPRMEYIDPFGLDYFLRIFRNERLKQ